MPVYYCNAFTIMLGTLNAKIYNLDTKEYDVTKWSDLDNVRYFYNFFKNMKMNLKSKYLNISSI